MKVYSIGREPGCNIVITDATDVVSRRHAILNVTSTGKMTIVDQSHNGTYVNGIRIAKNVPVPVTRKDSISFAHVARLNWDMVPKATSPLLYAMYAVIALIVLTGAMLGYKKIIGGSEQTPQEQVTAPVDSSKMDSKDKVRADSLQKEIAKRDSAQKAGAKKAEAEKEKAKGQQQKTGTNTPQPAEKKCATCKKPVSECEYKGKHPELCKTCKKPISECEHKGKHPEEKKDTVKKRRNV